jgi:hypothetical protein
MLLRLEILDRLGDFGPILADGLFGFRDCRLVDFLRQFSRIALRFQIGHDATNCDDARVRNLFGFGHGASMLRMREVVNESRGMCL